MILTNKTYDALKWITLVLLPAVGVLYLGLADVWGLPYASQIVATIAAIDLFLGALLGISTSTYRVNNPMYRLNLVKLVGNTENNWILQGSTYEILTWVAQILLPALATLYAALAAVWGLPLGDQVVATLMALDLFLGALLGFSTAQFHKKAAFACVEAPEAWTNIPD
jgi:hypothetical protein